MLRSNCSPLTRSLNSWPVSLLVVLISPLDHGFQSSQLIADAMASLALVALLQL